MTEAVSLDFAISACNYWISYCPSVELYSDCSGLMDVVANKPLCDIENKRLQRILIRAQNYNFNAHHVPAENNEICDALSRVGLFRALSTVQTIISIFCL